MKKYLILIFLIVISSSSVFSQFGSYGFSDARAMAMGNTGSAMVNGIVGLGRNPATLIHRLDSSFLQFNLPLHFNASVSTNTLKLSEVNSFFGGDTSRYLTDIDKETLINAFDGDGQFAGGFNMNYLTVAFMPDREIGAFAVSVVDNINAKLTLPQEMVQLLLNGNSPNQTYSFNNLAAQSSYIRTYSLSYARQLKHRKAETLRYVSFGLSAKIYMGYANMDVISENTKISVASDHKISGSFKAKGNTSFATGFQSMNPFDTTNKDFEFSPSPEAAGSGFGVDLGLAGEFQGGIRWGIAITDLGTMKWTANAQEHSISREFKINDITNNSDLDSLTKDIDVVSKDVSGYDGKLPTTLRLGVAIALDSLVEELQGFTATMDYYQGFNDFGFNSTAPKIGIGLEMYPWKYAPRLALGASSDVTGKFRLSGGIGYSLSFMDFYLATYDLLSIGGGNHASVAMNFVWKVF